MYAVMWSEHCGYKYSRPILQALQEVPRSHRRRGAGERRHHRHRRRLRRRDEDGEPQPPVRGRAVPGRGDRRRRHPARHLHHGRAAVRQPRQPAVRRVSTNARNRYLFEHVVGGIAFYGNCVGVPTVGGEVYFEDCYSGNCLVNAMSVGLMRTSRSCAPSPADPATRCCWSARETGRDGIRGATVAGEPGVRRDPREAPQRPDRRPVHREAADRGLPRAPAPAPRGRHSGHGRGGNHLLHLRDGRQGQVGMRHRRRPRPPARDRHGALGDHALREPGAHARDRRQGAAEDEVAGSSRSGASTAIVIGEVTD